MPPEELIDAIRGARPQVVGMSALLTTIFESFKSSVEAIKDAGLRDDVKIMIGGGTVTDDVREYSGADTYCKDAVEAVNLSKKWVEKRISVVNNSLLEQINLCVFNCH